MTDISRRQFLERAGAATMAGLAVAKGVAVRADPLGIPIGSQTYPVRARIAQGQFADVCKDMFAAGIRQIELCSPGYNEFKSLADGRQTKKTIEDAGLKCVSSHFSYGEFRDALPKAIEWAQAVGLTQMGVASLPANMGTQTEPNVIMVNGVTTGDGVKRAADAYGKIGAKTKAAGIQLFLHNETFENSRLDDGRLTYPVLLAALDPDLVKMQFQMSSMRTIGSPVMYFRMYPGRFISAHLHGVDLESPPPAPRGTPMPIKRPTPPAGAPGGGRGPAAGGPPGPPGPPAVAIGDDSVDWPAVLTAAKTGGMKNYFIEQEQPNGGWEAMVKGAAYLKSLNIT